MRALLALTIAGLVCTYSAEGQAYRPVSVPRELAPERLPLPSLMDYASQRPCPQGFEKEALGLMNRKREQSGLAPLRPQAHLEWAAREHTIRMATSGEMTHDGWKEVLRASGFRGVAWAQNVAWNQRTPDEVVGDWFDSSRHRANILRPDFRYTGVSCVLTYDGQVWWTQMFGA